MDIDAAKAGRKRQPYFVLRTRKEPGAEPRVQDKLATLSRMPPTVLQNLSDNLAALHQGVLRMAARRRSGDGSDA